MRHFLTIVIFLFFSNLIIAQNYYTVEDDFGNVSRYQVNAQFLEQLANHINSWASPYGDHADLRPFLLDIYNALKKGKSLTYYPDRNVLGGMQDSDWTAISSEDLERIRKRPKSGYFDAIFNTKKYQLYDAIGVLHSFYPHK